MGEIVNLRRVRKAKAREAAAEAAAVQRAKHGTSKRERAESAERQAQFERTLDGSKLEDQPQKG